MSRTIIVALFLCTIAVVSVAPNPVPDDNRISLRSASFENSEALEQLSSRVKRSLIDSLWELSKKIFRKILQIILAVINVILGNRLGGAHNIMKRSLEAINVDALFNGEMFGIGMAGNQLEFEDQGIDKTTGQLIKFAKQVFVLVRIWINAVVYKLGLKLLKVFN